MESERDVSEESTSYWSGIRRSLYFRGLVVSVYIFALLCIVNWKFRHVGLWWDAWGYVYPHSMEIYRGNLFPFLINYDVGHPTLFYFLYALLMKIFGTGPLAGHLLTWGFAAIGATGLFAVFRSFLIPQSVAAIAAVVFLAYPIVFSSMQQVMLDLPLTMLAIAAFACLRRNLMAG